MHPVSSSHINTNQTVLPQITRVLQFARVPTLYQVKRGISNDNIPVIGFVSSSNSQKPPRQSCLMYDPLRESGKVNLSTHPCCHWTGTHNRQTCTSTRIQCSVRVGRTPATGRSSPCRRRSTLFITSSVCFSSQRVSQQAHPRASQASVASTRRAD